MEYQPLRDYQENMAKGLKKKAKNQLYGIEFFFNLYLNYIETYKKLEDVYDQMLHPQKRTILRKMLDNTIYRMLELKKVTRRLTLGSNHAQ